MSKHILQNNEKIKHNIILDEIGPNSMLHIKLPEQLPLVNCRWTINNQTGELRGKSIKIAKAVINLR